MIVKLGFHNLTEEHRLRVSENRVLRVFKYKDEDREHYVMSIFPPDHQIL
jgi:hypothetical protein